VSGWFWKGDALRYATWNVALLREGWGAAGGCESGRGEAAMIWRGRSSTTFQVVGGGGRDGVSGWFWKGDALRYATWNVALLREGWGAAGGCESGRGGAAMIWRGRMVRRGAMSLAGGSVSNRSRGYSNNGNMR
jgi:hypothetical protein